MHDTAAAVKADVRSALVQATPGVTALAQHIARHPELAFCEHDAADRLTEFLADAGFSVTSGSYGLATAFTASAGHGPLHIAICAEYDALPPGIDRDGVPRPGTSHACGHHLMAGAAVAAAVGLREVVDHLGLAVSVIGTPGEELLGLVEAPQGQWAGGKASLLEASAFDDVHAALIAHPCPSPFGMFLATKACFRVNTRFDGITFADDPHSLNGLEDDLRRLLLRRGQVPFLYHEHTEVDANAALVDLGWYATTLDEGSDALRDVRACVETVASATGAPLALAEFVPYAEMRNDPMLAAVYRTNARNLGRTHEHDPQVLDQIHVLSQLYPHVVLNGVGLFLDRPPVEFPGGTDMGNVSRTLPAIHPFFGIGGLAYNHSAAFALQAQTDTAYAAMLDAGTALAWTVVDAAMEPDLKTHLTTRA